MKRIFSRSPINVSVQWTMGLGLLLIIGACTVTKPSPDPSAISEADVATIATANSGGRQNIKLLIDVFIVDAARSKPLVESAVASAVRLYEKCHITLQAKIMELAIAPDIVVSKAARYTLATRHVDAKPAVFIVSDTDVHDIAYAYLPAQKSEVSGTAWLTNQVSTTCLAWIMAHELGHLLMNSGVHSAGASNVMSNNCKATNWGARELNPEWTPAQCDALRSSEYTRG